MLAMRIWRETYIPNYYVVDLLHEEDVSAAFMANISINTQSN